MTYPVKKTLSLRNPKMLSHIYLCTQRHLNYFGFSIFWLTAYLIKVIPETHRTWWRSFQKRIVPDEGYSRNVPYEGYSRSASHVLNSICIFHSLLLVIWNWTNFKICLLNETFYKTNRIHGYVYLIFKQNAMTQGSKQIRETLSIYRWISPHMNSVITSLHVYHSQCLRAHDNWVL